VANAQGLVKTRIFSSTSLAYLLKWTAYGKERMVGWRRDKGGIPALPLSHLLPSSLAREMAAPVSQGQFQFPNFCLSGIIPSLRSPVIHHSPPSTPVKVSQG
jgi:hypothetical protein